MHLLQVQGVVYTAMGLAFEANFTIEVLFDVLKPAGVVLASDSNFAMLVSLAEGCLQSSET